jgi:isoleucyl-tRNA synthetase
LNHLTTVDLSAFYADVSKDRLYTFGAASRERRSAQTAMYIIADGLARLLAPILPVTTEEMWRHLPGEREVSVHLAEFPPVADLDVWRNEPLVARWKRLIEVRDVGARIVVRAGGETARLLASVQDDLAMLFIVSHAELDPTGDPDGPVEVSVEKAVGDKCPRCWRVVRSTDGATGLCDRCTAALRTQTDAVAR